MSAPPAPPPEPASPTERRSFRVFACFLVLALVACALPDLPQQALLGILWTTAGALMVFRPPVVRMPWLWLALAIGFVVLAAAGFLPRSWGASPAWRAEVEALGLATGGSLFVQPKLAAEGLAGFAMTALVGLFLLGHRVGTRHHSQLLLAFALGVGVWCTVALIRHQPGDATFGFFPNRNHSATLLAMGAFAGVGALAQAIRFREAWKIGLASIPAGLCLFTLFVVSESRGGMVLAAAGFMIWLPLTGLRHLRGHTGKAVMLLLAGFIGVFLIVDSKVKSRLEDTVAKVGGDVPSASAGSPGPSFADSAPPPVDVPLDGRVTIYEAAWEMSRGEAWTGVGPGQFPVVFTQYRQQAMGGNEARFVHPESDWWQMLTETGWPATLFLFSGVAAVTVAAIRRAWGSGARPLRMGSVVVALLVCLHGFIDVPGHRVGIAWSALLVMALALRPPRRRDRLPDQPAGPVFQWTWRGLGVCPLVAGLFLLLAQGRGVPLLPSARLIHLLDEVRILYESDQAAYREATAAGRKYDPPASRDPVEKALGKLDEALTIAPLDAHLHYLRGALALNFDDKNEVARHAFAVQRRLAPTHVNLALEQARLWLPVDPQESQALWREAMTRSAAEENRFPGSPYGTANTYHKVLHMAGKDEALGAFTLTLADTNPTLLVLWALNAPPTLLDREIPGRLPVIESLEVRLALFGAWHKYGSKAAARAFATTHPELGLPTR